LLIFGLLVAAAAGRENERQPRQHGSHAHRRSASRKL
jgi:hypothetical protein